MEGTEHQDFHSCYRTPDLRSVSERSLKGSLQGSLKGFLKGSAEGPLKTPLKRLQEPFEDPSRRCRNRCCVRLPGALKSVPGPRGPVAGNESLEQSTILALFRRRILGQNPAAPCSPGPFPRGPKDQKNSRFRSRLKISIENEIFERATHRSPIFLGKSRHRDYNFRARVKFSIKTSDTFLQIDRGKNQFQGPGVL